MGVIRRVIVTGGLLMLVELLLGWWWRTDGRDRMDGDCILILREGRKYLDDEEGVERPLLLCFGCRDSHTSLGFCSSRCRRGLFQNSNISLVD